MVKSEDNRGEGMLDTDLEKESFTGKEKEGESKQWYCSCTTKAIGLTVLTGLKVRCRGRLGTLRALHF